jgi:hypothetical protein
MHVGEVGHKKRASSKVVAGEEVDGAGDGEGDGPELVAGCYGEA